VPPKAYLTTYIRLNLSYDQQIAPSISDQISSNCGGQHKQIHTAYI
jgi:hypothetical protein